MPHLLSLPAEIREAIYKLVVESDWGSRPLDYFLQDRHLPALLLTCKQIRSEAFDTLLTKNNFHIYTSEAGMKCLRILGPEATRLRTISVCIDRDLDNWQVFVTSLLSHATGLKHVYIRKADQSLFTSRFEKFLRNMRFDDVAMWERSEGKYGEVIFRRQQ